MATTLDTLKVLGTVSSTMQGRLLGSVERMPAPEAACERYVVWYLGPSGDFDHGAFYRCERDCGAYRWVMILPDLFAAVEAMADLRANAVRSDTTVNGHPLDGDIRISAEDVGALPSTTFIPKRVSELANDGVWITQDCCTLANYYTKQQVEGMIADLTTFAVVEELPDDPGLHVFYALKGDEGLTLYARVADEWVEL